MSNTPPASKSEFIDLTNDSPIEADGNVSDSTVQADPIVLHSEDDDDDEDFKRAIALSLQDQHQGKGQSQHHDQDQDRNETPPPPQALTASSSNPLGFLGSLDRKQMEAERMSRLKRKRDETGPRVDDASPQGRGCDKSLFSSQRTRPVTVAAADAASTAVESAPTTSNMIQGSLPAHTTPRPRGVIASSAFTSATGPAGAAGAPLHSLPGTPLHFPPGTPQRYPRGIVRQTHCPGYPSTGTISFRDVVGPASDLKSCLLSSFIWDFDWLLPHFDTRHTSFVFVMHAKEAAHRAQLHADFTSIPNVKLCFPPMDGIVNCMHSKLMLLFYDHDPRCRIVIPTANLTSFDWGAGSVMENTVWLMDLPLKQSSSPGSGHETITTTRPRDGAETGFQKSLTAFLKAQTAPTDVIRKLQRYDFSNTADVGFVHSIGGMHEKDEWRTTGHCGLGQTISELGLATSEPIQIDYVTSSLGSLNDEFMRSMFLAAQGDDGLTEYTLRTARTLPAKRVGDDWRDKFRFYFPSHATVTASNGGPAAAGTICFSTTWWQSSRFPKGNMRDCVSVRDGLLMHNKVRVSLGRADAAISS